MAVALLNDVDPCVSMAIRSTNGKFTLDVTIPNYRAFSADVRVVYDQTSKRFDAEDMLLSTQVEADQRTRLLLQFFHL